MNKFYYMLLLCEQSDRQKVVKLFTAKKILWALLAVVLFVPIFFIEYFAVAAIAFVLRVVTVIAALSVEYAFVTTLRKARISQSGKLCEEGYENLRQLNKAHDIFMELNSNRMLRKLSSIIVLSTCVIASFSLNFIDDLDFIHALLVLACLWLGIAVYIAFAIFRFKLQKRTKIYFTENEELISTLQEQLASAATTDERTKKALKCTAAAGMANLDKQLSYFFYNKDLRKTYINKTNQLMMAAVIVGIVVGSFVGIAMVFEANRYFSAISALIGIGLVGLVVTIFCLRLSRVEKIQKSEYLADPLQFQLFLDYIVVAEKKSLFVWIDIIGFVAILVGCILLYMFEVLTIALLIGILLILFVAYFTSLFIITAKMQKSLIPLKKTIDETFYK